MNWLKVGITVSSEAAEALSATLITLSPSGIEIKDEDGNAALSAYLHESCPIEKVRLAIEDALTKAASLGLETGPGLITVDSIADEDWVENYKKHFHVIRVGRLLIKPSWEEAEAAAGDIVIGLDPGLAFGTGSHPTTEGCLIFLQEMISDKEVVFDLGTGSGILAIAAAKLGARRVVAIDNDGQAIEVAKENALANGVASKIDFAVADFATFHPVEASILTANLTAPAIIDFLPAITQKLPGLKVFIASGITVDQKSGVIKALKERGFQVEKTRTRGEWVSVVSRLG